MSLSHNGDFGLLVEDSTDLVIKGNSLSGNGISGLVLIDSRRALLARNAVSGSHGYAIPMFGVDDSTIQYNTLVGNDHGILNDHGSRDTIQRNWVSHSGGSAIDIGATSNRIINNRLTDNGDGIIATEAHDNLISHNTVTGTGFFGFPDTGGFGIILDGAGHNTVDTNIVTGGRGPAIFVTSLDSPTASKDNIVARNRANSRLDNGILVNNGAIGTLIQRNTANRSGEDGIHVDARATTLSGNKADRNHDLGIEAIPGVTDGGHNHAKHNGNPLQCSNIAC